MIEGSCGAPGKANTSKSQVKGNFGLWRPASWPKAGIDITLGDMRTGFSVVPTCAMPLKDEAIRQIEVVWEPKRVYSSLLRGYETLPVRIKS